jgi:integrase
MSRARRGRGEGSITQRPDGSWEGKVSLGFDAEGRRIRKSVYAATKEECREKLLKLQQETLTHSFVSSSLPLNKWLQMWVKELTLEPTTRERYEGLIKHKIDPLIGHLPLNKLQPMSVQFMLSEMKERGEADTNRKLAYIVLSAALKAAVKLKMMQTNPALEVMRPRPKTQEMACLTEDQCKMLMEEANKSRVGALITLALGSGMRQGEMLALEWTDIDFPAATVTVSKSLAQIKGHLHIKEPKTKGSRRTLSLPPFTIAALQAHYESHKREFTGFRPVFCTSRGTYYRRSNLHQYYFTPICERLGLDIRFHDLRHTHASLLLKAGENIKAISRRLGHSSITITLKYYAHLMPGHDEQLAGKMDTLLG